MGGWCARRVMQIFTATQHPTHRYTVLVTLLLGNGGSCKISCVLHYKNCGFFLIKEVLPTCKKYKEC